MSAVKVFWVVIGVPIDWIGRHYVISAAAGRTAVAAYCQQPPES